MRADAARPFLAPVRRDRAIRLSLYPNNGMETLIITTPNANARDLMEVLEAIKSGKSVSRFKPDPIPEQKVHAVVNAARLAPSVDNLQPWRFIAVSDEDMKRKLMGMTTNGRRLPEAPVVVVACARMDEAVGMIGGYMNSYPVDVGIALAHLTLAATSEGLGTSWVFAFNEEKVKALLRIPEDARVVGLTPLGIPEAHEPPSGRKHLSEILSYNAYD